MEAGERYRTFKAFYPFYLSEHDNINCRRLHVIGSLLVLTIVIGAFISGNAWLFLLALFTGYGFAWTGHFFFEKNRPATFQYPLYSFAADWVMLFDVLRGKIKI